MKLIKHGEYTLKEGQFVAIGIESGYPIYGVVIRQNETSPDHADLWGWSGFLNPSLDYIRLPYKSDLYSTMITPNSIKEVIDDEQKRMDIIDQFLDYGNKGRDLIAATLGGWVSLDEYAKTYAESTEI